jgi:ribosome-binding ATPase YchF (GTP1/OBG family)
MDVLLVVVRAFADTAVPHPNDRVDLLQDAIALELEMVVSDLGILQRRMERIEASLRGARGLERDQLVQEQAIIAVLREALEAETPIREQNVSAEAKPLLANFQLLTAKPLLFVVNAGDDQIPELEAFEVALSQRFRPPTSKVVALCGALEMELAQLSETEAAELRQSYGLSAESALDRVIRTSSELAGVAHFFTVGQDEVRAWTIAAQSPAVLAARAIHSDLERGFIRAEVIQWDKLLECGSLSAARQRGLLRTEGRDYHVQDGDVMHVLFNVGR